MAPHSSTLAWKIPWTEEPGRLQTIGLRRVGHDWATSLSLFTFMHWRRRWQPTPVFLPGKSQGQGSLVGCHLWVAQSQTRLKGLSSSSKHNNTRFKARKLVEREIHTPTFLCLDSGLWKDFVTLSYFLQRRKFPPSMWPGGQWLSCLHICSENKIWRPQDPAALRCLL